MPQLFQDEMAALGIADTGGAAITTPGSGIGMSPAQPTARRNPRQEEIAKMGGLDKFMSAVGEGSAAFLGRPSPLNQKIESQRKEKQLELEELKGYTSALEEGVKLTEGLEGPERDKFVKSYKARLDQLDAGLGDTFEAATKRPELLTKFKDILPHLPKPMQDMVTANPKGFLKFVGTAAGAEMMVKADDQRLLGTATKKAQITLMGLQQLIKPEKLAAFNKDGVITASEFREMQAELPEPLRLAPTEMEAIGRNDEMFWTGIGVLSGKKEQDVMGKRAEEAGKPEKPQSDLGKLKDDLKHGRITQVEYDAKYKKLTHIADGKGGEPSEADIVNREFKLSDDYRADTKKFAERRPLFDSATDYMANRGEQKSSSGDAALMFAYAKMRDPNDRLAVSETRDLVKLGNIFERFGVSVVGILEKGETLPDRVANDMYKEIRRSFTEQNRQQSKIEADYRRKTTDYKGNADRVVRPLAIPEDQLTGKGDKPKGDAQARKTIGSVNYVKIKGQWYEER